MGAALSLGPITPIMGAVFPDSMGSCSLLPSVNEQLNELHFLKTTHGETFPGSSYHPPERKNWMEPFSQHPIHRIVWPGTHDSATNGIGIQGISRPFAECQTLSVYDQLQMGVRAFDIRLQQDRLVCHDRLTSYNIDVVMSDVKRFLGETRAEIIILEIRTEYGQSDPHNFDNYLVEQLGEYLIYQDNTFFQKNIAELLPRRVVCVWKPRDSPRPVAGGPLWNEIYLRDDWTNTDMPLTKIQNNLNHLTEQPPLTRRNFFYRVEHTLTAQTDNPLEFMIPWTKDVEVISRRIRSFARYFLAQCHARGVLDRLQIFSTDFVSEDFVDACIGLTHERTL